ncbi:barstar family protein [Sphingomicrobium arenosum]|uniref:barstar family protein n=1 Tax=Sphingomicrobium arenosum TaxID=2233861 RepID=UPI00223FBE8D|nr:barstar family protein [Sphingomicrobium arenosum]
MTEEYVLDGASITSLEAFYDQISRSMALGDWGRNLDALDDVLCGEHGGVPENGFTLRWVRSDVSRANLGYPETVRQLEKRLSLCHPSNREMVQAELKTARQGRGDTVFDWLIDVFHAHKDSVRLLLA